MANAALASLGRPLPDTETNLDPAPGLAPGTLLAGRYRILAQLGLGGMGAVYKARDEELGLDIALKVLRPDLGGGPEWIEHLRQELVLARKVTHRNVVRIHDLEVGDGLRFLTMQLIEGRSLLDILEKDGPLPPERALRILHQLAGALQQAHEAGVVHCDLKPGNILLSPDDTAYVTDFGVARSLAREGSPRSGVVGGTLDYLSPEQAGGDTVDGRSDIYALGIVLFEMLTGQLPFRDSRPDAPEPRVFGGVRDIRETHVRVPAYVRSVVRRCLERRPARRYQSARALVVDLDAGRAAIRDRLPRPAVTLLVAAVLAGTGALAYRAGAPWAPPPPSVLRPPAPVPASIAVAVLPLSDETGDPSLAWAATGLAEMLTAHLAESPQLRVLDSARVMRTLRDVHLSRLTGEEAELRRLAELLEAGHLVTGSIRRAGRTTRVDVRLVSVQGSRAVGQRSIGAETPDPEGVFRLVGQLGDRLRMELAAAPATDRLATEPPTTSVEAAKAYREGRERLLVGDSVGAAPAFERAIQADPRFTAALLGLSEAYQTLGYHDKALAAAEKATDTTGSAETHLAWRARARLALLRGDLTEAEKSYAELARRYPNDTEALLELAQAQASQGASAKAVLTFKRLTELDRGDPRAWFHLGKNMILAGDARQALTDPLVRALALMTQLGNEQGRGDVLNAMGVAHHRLGEFPLAIAKYGEAAAIRKSIGDERGAATSLRNRASIYLAMGRLAEAEPDLASARAVYARIGNREGLANIWNDFGALHEGRGDYAAALKSYQRALRIRRDLGNEGQAAQSYDNIGYIFFLKGAYDNAFVYWQQALDLRRKIGDKGGVVLSLQNMGLLQTARGRWPEAMKSFVAALEQGRQIEFANAMAVSHGNIGLLHQYDGRYAAALSAYEDALQILRGLGDRRGLTEFTIRQALLLIELGRLDEAEGKLEAAASWVRETRNREQSSDLQAALGQWHLARSEAEEARKAFAQAVESARASGSPVVILRARIARGAALVALGDAAAAERELTSALREADDLGDPLLRIRASEALARAKLAQGRLPAAAELARRALNQAERCGWEAGLFRLQVLVGQVQERRGDASGAVAAYRDGARHVERLREGLPAELRSSFDGLPSVRELEAWIAAHDPPAPR